MLVDQWTDLPLFPLNTVLFPGMVLPLHIFEERYKLMISRCLELERPFGVLLIRKGKEVGGGAVPYDVGTTAYIARVNHLEEGKMDVVAIGNERFRLESVRFEQPYPVGSAQPWPLMSSEKDAQKWVEPTRALFRQYLSLLAQAEGHKIEIDDLPTEPKTLALTIAIALQLSLPAKQRLLRQPTVESMLLAEWSIMRREQLILNYIIRTQTVQWEGGFSGYLAKN